MNEVMLVKVDGVLQPRMVARRMVYTTMDGEAVHMQPEPEIREGEMLLQFGDRPYEIRSASPLWKP